MVKFSGFLGATVVGYVAWWAVDDYGFMTAFIVSTIASGFGLYYGVKLAKKYLP